MRSVLAFTGLLIGLTFSFFAPTAEGAVTLQSMQCNKPFVKIVHICGTTVGKGAANGNDYSNCVPFADTDLFAIPAGTLINKVYAKIDVAVTGTTAFKVGDDDAAEGFLPDASIASGLGTPGVYGWDAKTTGSYLRISTAGATDAGDIYVVPSAKYYAAAGKEVKLDITTANTAGKVRVFIEGFKFCDAY